MNQSDNRKDRYLCYDTCGKRVDQGEWQEKNGENFRDYPFQVADTGNYTPRLVDVLDLLQKADCVSEQTNAFLQALDKRIWISNHSDVNRGIYIMVKGFVNDLLKTAKELEPGLMVNVIESGSFFSNLRVGSVYEFDFMLDLTPMFDKGMGRLSYSVKPVHQESGLLNHIPSSKVLYQVLNEQENLFSDRKSDRPEMIEPWVMQNKMFALFRKAVNVIKEKWTISRYPLERHCSPSFEVSLEVQGVEVSIDLVPCFRFPYHESEPNAIPCLRKDTEHFIESMLENEKHSHKRSSYDRLFLVSNANKGQYFVNAHERFFRISTSLIEKEIFNALDPKILQAIRIVKYLFQTFFTECISYHGPLWDTLDTPRETPHIEDIRSYLSTYVILNSILNVLIVNNTANLTSKSLGKLVLFFLEVLETLLSCFIPVELSNSQDQPEENCAVPLEVSCTINASEQESSIPFILPNNPNIPADNSVTALEISNVRNLPDDYCPLPLDVLETAPNDPIPIEAYENMKFPKDKTLIIHGWCFENVNSLKLHNGFDYVWVVSRLKTCVELLHQNLGDLDLSLFPLTGCTPVLCIECLGDSFDETREVTISEIATDECFLHKVLKRFKENISGMVDKKVLVYCQREVVT